MGHENIGVIAKAGREFTRRKGFKEGDLVFVEHYVSCGKCEWCHAGQYRHCENTNWRTNPDAIRYGYTSIERPPHLWGGFAQYVYLPWNAVVHHVPKGVTPGGTWCSTAFHGRYMYCANPPHRCGGFSSEV